MPFPTWVKRHERRSLLIDCGHPKNQREVYRWDRSDVYRNSTVLPAALM
jgi:hypothetical protein